jgi:hypothetical protein
MSANSPPPPGPHCVGILMSPEGRFLECRNCKLSFRFPVGAKYDDVATHFDSYVCLFSTRIPDRPRERGFGMVRYVGIVPVMASCAGCQRKFFTPSAIFATNPAGAEEYLRRKFDLHDCN